MWCGGKQSGGAQFIIATVGLIVKVQAPVKKEHRKKTSTLAVVDDTAGYRIEIKKGESI